MKLSERQLVNLMHVVLVGPLLLYVGLRGPKCPKTVFHLLTATGLGVFIYHLYLLVSSLVREGFIHQGGYLGRPEAFTSFSYPYNKENGNYSSYHDDENKRHTACTHQEKEVAPEEVAVEGFMLPNFGMKPVVPNM